MGLNIKNERVCELAREAAALAGTTQTSAIEAALLRYIAEHDATRLKAERVHQVQHTLAWFDQHITEAQRDSARRFMEEMYDEDGLPR